MAKTAVFRPKITDAQRIIIVRALRGYLFRLVSELDEKRPIGREYKAQVDHLEDCLLIYRRFRNRNIGRRYPHWWKTSYDSRLTEIFYELQKDAREEDLEGDR